MVDAKGNIKELGVRYLRIVFFGSLFVNFAQAGNMTMRGEGSLKPINDDYGNGSHTQHYVRPYSYKPMGEYAIEGAAIATVLSQSVQVLLTFHYFSKKSSFAKIHTVKKYKVIYREMFSIGSSAMMMQILFAVQQTFLFKQAFVYGGDNWRILMSAIMRLYMFSFIPLGRMSQGLQLVIGANFGAKQYGRVKDTMKIFIYGVTILVAALWIPSMFCSDTLLSLFSVRHEIIEAGKKAGIIVLLRQLVLFVPAILLLPKLFGVSAVWWAEPIVDFTMIIAGLFLMLNVMRKMGKDAV